MCTSVEIPCLRDLPWVEAGSKEGPNSKWREVKESSWRGRGLELQLGAGLQISQIYMVREGHSMQRECYS